MAAPFGSQPTITSSAQQHTKLTEADNGRIQKQAALLCSVRTMYDVRCTLPYPPLP